MQHSKPQQRRRRAAHEIAQLQKELMRKMRVCSELERENSSLQRQHNILLAIADSLEFLRQHLRAAIDAADGADDGDVPLASVGASLASVEELLLLEQLQQIPCAGTSTSSEAPSAAARGASSSLAGSGSSSGDGVSSDSASQQAAELLPPPPPPQQQQQQQQQDAQSLPPSDELLAPPDDAFQLFRRLMLAPPFPGADAIRTVGDMQRRYARTVRELSLALHQHAALAGAPPAHVLAAAGGGAAPLERMKQLVFEHFSMLLTLVLTQRGDLLTLFACSNSDTGELLPRPPAARLPWVVQQLALTQAQRQQLADGHAVFFQLLRPLQAQLEALKRELGGGAGGAGSGADGGGSESASLAANDPAAAAEPAAADPAAAAVAAAAAGPAPLRALAAAEAREAKLQAWQALQRRNYLARCLASCFLFTRFTAPQLARMAALSAPFVPDVLQLAAFVAEEGAAAAAAPAQRTAAAAARTSGSLRGQHAQQQQPPPPQQQPRIEAR